MKGMLRKFIRYLCRLPLSYSVFTFTSVLFLSFFIIQVNCPICGNIDISVVQNEPTSFEVQKVEGILIDHTVHHGWCANVFVNASYKVSITIKNDGSERTSKAVLIKGEMPMVILSQYAAAIGNKAKLLNIEIPPYEVIEIVEDIELWAVGLTITRDILAQASFSVTTDPEKIVDYCPICDGKQKVSLADALIFGVE